MATPLFLVLLVVESMDLIFAVDSIPAIFAVTDNPSIVYTSNVFAILGLRSLYFLLAGVVDKFHYLKLGLLAVLVFVGIKMLLTDIYKIPIGIGGDCQHPYYIDCSFHPARPRLTELEETATQTAYSASNKDALFHSRTERLCLSNSADDRFSEIKTLFFSTFCSSYSSGHKILYLLTHLSIAFCNSPPNNSRTRGSTVKRYRFVSGSSRKFTSNVTETMVKVTKVTTAKKTRSALSCDTINFKP